MAKLFSRRLKPGDKGPDVNMLGLLLRAVGFDDQHAIGFDCDFAPGGKIEAALREYQDASSLEVTGELDQATLD